MTQRAELERHIILRGRRAGKSVVKNLMDQVMEEQAKQMAESIDFDFLASILSEDGWTVVEQWMPRWNEVDEWLKDNCKGSYKRNGHRFLFELPRDVTWFRLRWSCD